MFTMANTQHSKQLQANQVEILTTKQEIKNRSTMRKPPNPRPIKKRDGQIYCIQVIDKEQDNQSSQPQAKHMRQTEAIKTFGHKFQVLLPQVAELEFQVRGGQIKRQG